VLNLLEATGRIRHGEKLHEPFVEYLKQKAIYEEKYGVWKLKKAMGMRRRKKRINF